MKINYTKIKNALFKFALLLCSSTISAGLIVYTCSAIYAVTRHGAGLAEAFKIEKDKNFLNTIIQLGIVGGVFGLGYAHTFLAYLLVLKNCKNFWRNFLLNIFLLLLASIIMGSLLLCLPISSFADTPIALMVGTALSFWIMVILIKRFSPNS